MANGRQVRKPLSGKALVMASAVVVVLTAVIVVALWWPATKGLTGNDLVGARFDALRIGLSIGVGSGGIIVLYLAWRRQRSMEDTLAHQERVAESTEEDARERRITDLYTKAADQLGSDKAAVRLAGLYALERLAQDHPAQRETIVNVLCAYLRMPFDLPAEVPPDIDGIGGAIRKNSEGVEIDYEQGRQIRRELLADHRARVQEREVRRAAQRLLATHSRTGPGGVGNPANTYWPGLEFDLTGATLDAPDFSHCHLDFLILVKACVSGNAKFSGVKFINGMSFDGTKFCGSASFDGARFGGVARFEQAEFGGDVRFGGVRFDRAVRFGGTRFGGIARFGGAVFSGDVRFVGAEFGEVSFDATRFGRNAGFGKVKFGGDVTFDRARFGGDATFGKARFDRGVTFTKATFVGEVGFAGARFGGALGRRGAMFANGLPRELAALDKADHEDGPVHDQ